MATELFTKHSTLCSAVSILHHKYACQWCSCCCTDKGVTCTLSKRNLYDAINLAKN